MKIKDILDWATRELIAFDSARLDVELLLAHVLGKRLTYVLAHNEAEVGFWNMRKYKKFVARRKNGEPLAYLRGYKEFYGRKFEVNKHVLVPRPDTELLVEAVSNYISGDDLLLDVGTGSGCIPISVVKEVPKLEAVAVDISSAALKVARNNAHSHHTSSRMIFVQSDLMINVDPVLFEGWETVVTANLPYVPKDYQVNVETKFEPQIALYGGDDGLDIYKRLVGQLSVLKPKAMFFECFEFQVAILAEHLPDYELKFVKNALGKASIMMLERR